MFASQPNEFGKGIALNCLRSVHSYGWHKRVQSLTHYRHHHHHHQQWWATYHAISDLNGITNHSVYCNLVKMANQLRHSGGNNSWMCHSICSFVSFSTRSTPALVSLSLFSPLLLGASLFKPFYYYGCYYSNAVMSLSSSTKRAKNENFPFSMDGNRIPSGAGATTAPGFISMRCTTVDETKTTFFRDHQFYLEGTLEF